MCPNGCICSISCTTPAIPSATSASDGFTFFFAVFTVDGSCSGTVVSIFCFAGTVETSSFAKGTSSSKKSPEITGSAGGKISPAKTGSTFETSLATVSCESAERAILSDFLTFGKSWVSVISPNSSDLLFLDFFPSILVSIETPETLWSIRRF